MDRPSRYSLTRLTRHLSVTCFILLISGGPALEGLAQANRPVADRKERQTRRASKRMNPQARHLTAAVPDRGTPAPHNDERTALTPVPAVDRSTKQGSMRREYAQQQRQTDRAERRAEKIARKDARDRAKLQRKQDRVRAGENNRRTIFRKRTRR